MFPRFWKLRPQFFILLLPPFWKFSQNNTLSIVLYQPFILCKMNSFQGLNSWLNHKLKTRITYVICQCKNYSWLILCIMTWGCNVVIEIKFLVVSYPSSSPLTFLYFSPNIFLYFMVLYQNYFPSFYFDISILTILGI